MSLMKCPKGHIVPDESITCPLCARDRCESALLALQAVLLRKVAEKRMGYSLLVTKTHEQHVLMYSLVWPDLRTFCGANLRTKPQIKALPYHDLELLCPACRKVVEGLVMGTDKTDKTPAQVS